MRRFHYTMLAWLPTFFTDTLSMNITQAAQISLLPPFAALAASCVAGPAADALIENGWPVGRVRKLAQLVAFLGPASCLLLAMALDDGYITVGSSPSLHAWYIFGNHEHVRDYLHGSRWGARIRYAC